MTKAEYQHKWDRFQKRYERIYTTKFTKALKEQVAQFAVKKDITLFPIYEVLVDLYKTVGPLWAHYTDVIQRREIRELKAAPMGFNERIVELMRLYYGIDLLNDAELMTRYSREVIANVLSNAAITGASFDDIVKELLAHPEFSAMRARRIARTETVTASNTAALINAKEKKIKYKKEWSAVNDNRTRHSHREIDGVTVPLDNAFNVNGTMMEQPGVRKQPNGLSVPASEVVNCRCVLLFKPVLGKDKLPIRI